VIVHRCLIRLKSLIGKLTQDHWVATLENKPTRRGFRAHDLDFATPLGKSRFQSGIPIRSNSILRIGVSDSECIPLVDTFGYEENGEGFD